MERTRLRKAGEILTSKRCPDCGGKLIKEPMKGVSEQVRKWGINAGRYECKKCHSIYRKERRSWKLVSKPKKVETNDETSD